MGYTLALVALVRVNKTSAQVPHADESAPVTKVYDTTSLSKMDRNFVTEWTRRNKTLLAKLNGETEWTLLTALR
jgi:hypothetical protein